MTTRRTSEEAAAEEDRRVAGLLRAAADRREGLARLAGQVNAVQSRAAAADEEIGRLEASRAAAVARADRAQHDFTALETRIAGLDAGEEGLDTEHEAALAVLDDLTERLAKAREEAAQADRDRSGLQARTEALSLGLNRKDGVGALLAASDSVSGLLGSVAAVLTVDAGYETAIAAALGSAADAVAVTDGDAAVSAIDHLKTGDLGRAGLLLGGGVTDDPARWPGLPGHASYAVDVVSCPDTLRPSLARLLFKTAVVGDLDAARALVADLPDVTAVTREGDVYGAHFAAGGSASQPSLLEIQAAYDDASAQLSEAIAASERLGFDIARLDTERLDAQRRVDVALAKLHESDATLAAVAEELGHYGTTARSARAEAERIATAIAAAQEARDQDLAGLADLESRLAAAHDATDEEPDTTQRERLADAARAARQAEMDARLALRTSEERARALHGRADSLVRAAEAEREARARAIERRERLVREGRAAQAVGVAVTVVLAKLEVSIHRAAEERAAVEATRAEREQELLTVRSTLRDLAREHDELVNSVHRDEMARTQQRMRIEQLAERAMEELGLDEDALVADYGPDQLVPFTGELADGETAPDPAPYDREEQAKRLRAAERALALLGKVNPLALEEFSALEERHKFLTEQLEDLKATRKDLLDIVREVDARVQQVFTEAYADVSAAFDETFSRLFPGGEGRLVLTDPSDMLTTGVEVEARPPGQEGQAPVAALRRRAVAGGGRLPGGALQGPPLAVLHPRRGRGGARRHQPRPPAADLRGAPRPQPAARDHPPEAHHGGRRRPLRRHHARRRRLDGDQPAPPRTRLIPGGSSHRSLPKRWLTHRHPAGSGTLSRDRRTDRPARPTRADFVHWSTATTRWADMDGFGHMNNARYFELIDTAIDVHLQEAIGGAVDTLDQIGLFAEIGCRFFAEVGYPAPIDLGVVVDHVGRSSIVYRVGFFQGDGDERGRRGARGHGLRRQHRPGAPVHAPARRRTTCRRGRGPDADGRPRPARRRLPRAAARLAARDPAAGPRRAAPGRPRDDRDDQADGPALLRPRRQRRGVPRRARPRERLRLRRRDRARPRRPDHRRPGEQDGPDDRLPRGGRRTRGGAAGGSSGGWWPTTGPAAGGGSRTDRRGESF